MQPTRIFRIFGKKFISAIWDLEPGFKWISKFFSFKAEIFDDENIFVNLLTFDP